MHRRAVLSGLLLAVASPAAAVECAAIPGGSPELSRIDAVERLHFIREHMRVSARNTRMWTYTWTGIYSSLMVLNIGLATTGNHDEQVDRGVAAASSFIGVLSLALVPPAVIGDQFRLERRLRVASLETDPCAPLADAERLLIRDAGRQAFGKGSLVRTGAWLYNIGIGILLGVGFDLWDKAALQTFVGIAVSEISRASQPDELVDDLERYRSGKLTAPRRRPSPFSWSVAPLVLPGPRQAGLVVAGSF